MPTKRTIKKVKAYAVCFYLNSQCMTGDLSFFTCRKDAKEYITDLHKKTGGFEEDHHIVPCVITYTLHNAKK